MNLFETITEAIKPVEPVDYNSIAAKLINDSTEFENSEDGDFKMAELETERTIGGIDYSLVVYVDYDVTKINEDDTNYSDHSFNITGLTVIGIDEDGDETFLC